MIYAIILAGGKGARFWPLSRELEPKQFMNVYSNKPMIEEAIERIGPLVKKENIYIATGRIYNKKIEKCVKKLNIPSGNILFEPESKNTFAPIAALSARINKADPEAVIVVFPSDHFIKHNDKFLRILKKGIEIAKNDYIVSLGILPKRPETGYGYIRIKSRVKKSLPALPRRQAGGRLEKSKVFEIDRFVEKPSLQRAKRFIKDKRYYWNGGIFIFTPRVILEEIKKFMPDIHNFIMKIESKEDVIRLWHKLPSLSIDCAIMEKTRRMALLPLDCGWIDLGSWEAISEVAKKDKDGNIFRGKYIDIGSKNTLVWSQGRLITTLGLKNIIIVDTQDALLVCRRDMSQDVKSIVKKLKKKNFKGEI